MLTSECFLPPLIQLSHPASLLSSIGFLWDPTLQKMRKVGYKRYSVHKATSYLHLFLTCIVILQMMLCGFKGKLSLLLISSFGLIIIIFCDITVQVYRRNLEKCVSLINELIITSSDLQNLNGVKLKLDTKEKFIKILAPTFHWSAMAVPFAFVGGVVWSMPCMPSNLGYFLLEECSQEGSLVSGHPYIILFSKFLFLPTNLWIWSYGVQCAVFVVIVVMLGAMSIRSFLKIYERSMLSIASSSPQGNSKILKKAIVFRRIQLLTQRFNAIHKSQILVPLLFTVTSHQVFSVYGVIKLNSQLNFVSYALFGILGSQGILVIMGMFSGLADVFTMSVRVKAKLEKSHRSHRWLQRFHLACPFIKISFGAMNFIDSFSPLAFENFAFMQTANMLMVE